MDPLNLWLVLDFLNNQIQMMQDKMTMNYYDITLILVSLNNWLVSYGNDYP